jgi:antitoxin ParD1/3/4
MPSRASFNISLPPALRRFIDERIRSGRYESPDDVVREALRLLHDRERERDAAVDEIRRKIAAGVASAKRGEFFDGEEFFADWRREIRQQARKRRSA